VAPPRTFLLAEQYFAFAYRGTDRCDDAGGVAHD
jgi:hypothetical protein